MQAESVDDTSPEWRREKVSYAAAYGDERIPAYLFLPKNAKPPYQVMVGFSGANVFYERSSATTTDFDRFTFIMRSGRAFLYPIYKSTFERGDGLKSDTPDMTAGFRDHMIMWSKDVGRSVDYLESRSDIAKDRIGYIGLSTGAALAPVFLAIERRISLGVIYMGGINLQPSLPEADTVNFAPRVTATRADAQRTLRLFLPDGQLPGAAVQAPRHPSRTQTPRRLRRGAQYPEDRDDQGSGGLDGEVLGETDAALRACVRATYWSLFLS